MTTAFVKTVLEDPNNDFAEIVRVFDASGESCWHVDRHVLDVSEAQQAGADLLLAACMAALALARQWLEAASTLRESGLLISRPFVIIDDEWIAGASGAPPPHVYVCVARDEASFEPVRHEEATPRASGNRMLDLQLTERERLLRVEGALEGEPGAWMIEFLDR